MLLKNYSEERIKEYKDLGYNYELIHANEKNYVYKMINDRMITFYIVFYLCENSPYGTVYSENKYKEIENNLSI